MPPPLIVHPRSANGRSGFEAAVRVDDGRIARVETVLSAGANGTAVDAGGRTPLPGSSAGRMRFGEIGAKREASISGRPVQAAEASDAVGRGHVRDACATNRLIVGDIHDTARREGALSESGEASLERRAFNLRVAAARAGRRHASGGAYPLAVPDAQCLRVQR